MLVLREIRRLINCQDMHRLMEFYVWRMETSLNALLKGSENEDNNNNVNIPRMRKLRVREGEGR
jgi:hypothetical protein